MAALRAVVDSSPAAGLGPIEAARILGVDKTFASRLMTSLRAVDSLAALHSLPGTVPLRQFIRAARGKGADRTATQAAEAELAAFDQVLQRTFGTRTHLDAVIADSLPEANRKQNETARQAVFRGMTLIKGVSFDLASISWLFHPNKETPSRTDMLVIAAFNGIRRLRPTAKVRLMSNYSRRRPESSPAILTEFCRPSDLSINVTRNENSIAYEIATGPIRRDATSDVVLVEHLPAAFDARNPSTDGNWFGCGDVIMHPYKRLILSALVHRDVWPGCGFSVRGYETAQRGVVKQGDPAREQDRFAIDVRVSRSPVTPDSLRAFPVRGFAEIVRAVAEPRDWALNDFRVFSSEFVYPLYGSQIMMVHEPG